MEMYLVMVVGDGSRWWLMLVVNDGDNDGKIKDGGYRKKCEDKKDRSIRKEVVEERRRKDRENYLLNSKNNSLDKRFPTVPN